MSLSRKIAHNTLLQVMGKFASTGLGLLAVAMMTRNLGAERFGWYVTATGFLQFVGILIDFGFTVTTSNMLSEPDFDKDKLFNTIFTWRFFTALFFFGLSPFIILVFPYRTEIDVAVAITSFSFFCITISQVFIGYYRQKLSMLVPTISEVLGRVILVAGIYIAIIGNYGFLPIMGAITLASIVSTIYLIFKFGRVKFSFDRDISGAIFIKIWPTALSVIFNSIYLQADRVILPLYVSQAEVGLYGAAYRVLDVVIQIAAIVMGMIMPLITFSWSRGLVEEFKERYQLAVDFMALILFPIIAGVFVLSGPMMNFVASDKFAGSGDMLKWLSISILGTCFGMIFGHIVLAINKQKQALFIYGSDALLSIIGYFVFIPTYGWKGAVGVTIFSEIYAGILLTFLSIYYSKVFPDFKTVAKIALASFIMVLVIYAASFDSLFVSILLGGLTYTAVSVLLKVIKLSSIKELLSFSKFARNRQF